MKFKSSDNPLNFTILAYEALVFQNILHPNVDYPVINSIRISSSWYIINLSMKLSVRSDPEMKNKSHINNEPNFEVIFKIVSICGAIATTIWCCYEFSKNEDMCEVYYKRFLQDDQSIYPDITVLMPYQLNETAFRELRTAINTTTFRQILEGTHWDDEILQIPLEDVRLKLSDNLMSSCILSSYYDPCSTIETINNKMFLGGAMSHAFQLPRDKLTTYATFQFRTAMFSNGVAPAQHELMISFQYPNRVYRSQGSLFQIEWPLNEEEKRDNYVIDFKMRDMEVLRRRQKRGSACLEVHDYDEKKKEDMMLEVGCRPYFWNHSTIDKICKTQKETQGLMSRNAEIFYRLNQKETDIPPCTEIQKLQIDHNIRTTKMAFVEEQTKKRKENIRNETWFEIRLEIQTDTFKEIRQKRAYTPQSLVGNLGGYLGLFIGFTLLDLFKSFLRMYSRVMKYLSFSPESLKTQQRSNVESNFSTNDESCS